ncbi:MAG: DUF87 domain-containing protein [Myxococcales bacterium]|nr:DUF87 domain-containing protein [Myxococcales bacterium]
MTFKPRGRKKISSRDAARKTYERVYSRPVVDPFAVPEDGLIVGPEVSTKQPVYLRYQDLQNGLHVLGGPGSGKSNFLRAFCNQLLLHKQKTGNGFGIIDPHGTLSRYVRDLVATQYRELAGEVVYLDLQQSSKVLGFNPLARANEENAYYVASSITEAIIKACGARSSSDLPTISNVMTNMCEALAYTEGAIPDMEYFLYRAAENRAVLRALLDRIPSRGPTRSARIFWEDFDQKTRQAFEAATVGPLNRLNRLIRPQEFRRILAAPQESLDVRTVMDEGGIALFDLSAPPGTNVSQDGQNLMSALLFQEFNQAWVNRVPDQARPFVLICDEFGDYVSGDVSRVITGARKFGLWCVFSHQNLSQLVGPDEDKELLYTILSIPNKAVFRGLYIDEAEVIARAMYLAGLDPDRIKHVVRTVTWDPIPTKVTMRGRSAGGGTSDTETETSTAGGSSQETNAATETSAAGHSSSKGVTRDEEGREVESELTGDSESQSRLEGTSHSESSSWSRSSGHSFTSNHSWSESEQEAWVTFYRQRIQEGARSYEALADQVFKHAKNLVLAPQGLGAIARQGQFPRDCRVPHMQELDIPDAEIFEFMKEVYAGKGRTFYIDSGAVDKFLEERETKLLESAEPQIEDASWGSSKKKKPRRRS